MLIIKEIEVDDYSGYNEIKQTQDASKGRLEDKLH
jgi:hypothetical protein